MSQEGNTALMLTASFQLFFLSHQGAAGSVVVKSFVERHMTLAELQGLPRFGLPIIHETKRREKGTGYVNSGLLCVDEFSIDKLPARQRELRERPAADS